MTSQQAPKTSAVEIVDGLLHNVESIVVSSEAEVLPLSQLIGVPILVQINPQSETYVSNAHRTAVSYLFLNCDPEKDEFGLIPMHWIEIEHSVYITRKDLTAITKHEVEVITLYITKHLRPLINWELWTTQSPRPDAADLIRDFANAEMLDAFFEVQRTAKQHEDSSWTTAVNPFATAESNASKREECIAKLREAMRKVEVEFGTTVTQNGFAQNDEEVFYESGSDRDDYYDDDLDSVEELAERYASRTFDC